MNKDWIYEYECDGCGACCTCFSVPLTEDDLAREPLIKPHVWKDGDKVLLAGNDGCPMLDEIGRCSIHATKPDVCARFRAGDPGCQYARGKAGLSMLCGKWVPRRVPLVMV